MFSGIGGFELGIQRAQSKKLSGQDIRSGKNSDSPEQGVGQQQYTCIGYSEIDKYAIKVYERQFNGHINYGDCTAINAAELPDFDLLVGGFPCQAFSIAGKRYGFQDTRGTLFFDIARILANKRPRHLVLENVKGLLSHDNGKTFQTIIGVLTDLGYTVEWQVLNSKDFGVPQNRERVIIVGHLGGQPSRKVFPITGDSQQIASVAGYISEEVWPRRHEQIRRTYNTDGAMPTIPTGQGGGVMTKIYQKPRIRRLTPLECERLQGFPDNWTKYGEDEHGVRVDISDTQRYKMCGNAVTTNVIQAVIERLTIDNSVSQ
jgi:DNA (cytosine-5)-methyltransferase 1